MKTELNQTLKYLIVRNESVIAICDLLNAAFVFAVHSYCIDGAGVYIKTVIAQDHGCWVENSEFFVLINRDHVESYFRDKNRDWN